MINELIFFIYIFCVGSAGVIATYVGAEALVALMSVQAILANLFVAEQITLFGLTATASDALGVGTTICLNLLQEFYGQEQAKRAIWISFFCAFLYSMLSVLQLAYTPSLHDTMYPHFCAIFTPMPRIMGASLISYLIVQNIDYRLYGILKKYFHGHWYSLRNILSISVTQLLDTIIFTFLGLWGIMSDLSDIILVSYAIKLVVIFCSVPMLALFKTHMLNKR